MTIRTSIVLHAITNWFVEYVWNIMVWIEQGVLVILGFKYNDSLDVQIKKFFFKEFPDRRKKDRRRS